VWRTLASGLALLLSFAGCKESLRPRIAAQLAFTVQPTNATARAAISPAVRVTVQDADGNTVTNATTSITLAIGANAGGGVLSGTTTADAVNGVVTFSHLSIDKLGTGYTLMATSTGLTAATSATFDVTPGPAAQLSFAVQPTGATAGTAISPAVTVTVQDAGGNTVTSATTSITVAIGTNPGGGTLSGTATVAAVGGVATFSNLSIDRAGAGYTLNAAATGLTGATSVTFDVAGAAVKLAFTVQPTGATAGATITPAVRVTVQDAGGNTVTKATTNITLAIGTNAGGGTLSGTATVAAVNGVATFSNLSIDKTGTGYTLTAAATGLTGATSATFNVTATAAKLAFSVQPTNATAGAAISPAVKVTVQDVDGNTVTSATTRITVAIGTNFGGGTLSGTASGTATVAAVAGVATFSNLSIDKAGTGYTLTAAATGLAVAISASFTVTGEATGAAAQLAFTVEPTGTLTGTAITPAVAVTVLDVRGNTVTNASTSITLAIGTNFGGGTLSGTTTVAAVNGVATFSNLSIDKPGTGYTLTAAATGLTGATSTTFNVTSAAAKLAFTVQPTNIFAGVAITPAVAVTVQDAGGNTVTSTTTSITLAIGTNPGGGTLSGTATVAAVGGVATFSNLSIDRAGAGYTLTAAATGLTGATSMPFGVLPLVQFVAASAGSEFTCALTMAGGAYCWGSNWLGQLGTGTVSLGSSLPQEVQGNLRFSEISASGASSGQDFACGLTVSGAAYCWGSNGSGQLGIGGAVNASAPVPVAGGLQFTSLAVGGAHACALTAAGLAYCWGANGYGQLGTGNGQSSSAPVRVVGGLLFVSLSAGSGHTCALTAAGAAYCWGSNGYGQLGDGTASVLSATPVPVAGGATFASVSAGAVHTCGVTTGGAGFCWGDNSSGQLGAGLTGGQSAVPVVVVGSLTFTTIVAGYTQTCGIAVSGAAHCWGDNGSGQLGTGSYVGSPSPMPVAGGLAFTSLTAGGDLIFGGSSSWGSSSYVVAHTCGVTTGGLYCWGDNAYGKLGSPSGSAVPVKVVGQP
jgi:alpha-tubulin suppressor-like RCC1 family protein